MAKKIKKPIIGEFTRFTRALLRKIPLFNEIENEQLTDDFNNRILEIKEENSKIVWDAYYVPKAINAILKEDGYLTTEKGAWQRAKAMLLYDLSCGVLDEFYRFKEEVQ